MHVLFHHLIDSESFDEIRCDYSQPLVAQDLDRAVVGLQGNLECDLLLRDEVLLRLNVGGRFDKIFERGEEGLSRGSLAGSQS